MAPKRKIVEVEEEEEEEEDIEDDSGDENDSEDDEDDEDGDEDEDNENDSDDEEDDEDGDDEEEDDDDSPKKKSKKSPAASKAKKPTIKSKAKDSKKKKVTKKSKKVLKKKVTKKSKKSSSSASIETVKVQKSKVMKKLERLEEARKAYKWWEAPSLDNDVNWISLEHPGVYFAPAYVRHNVSLLYDGKPVELTAEQEEIATFYASIPEDGPQLGNPKTRKIFQDNFFEDFKQSLGAGSIIKDFKKCDFSLIKKHLDVQKELRKALTEEEKSLKKSEKEAVQLRYGYALIDGRMEKIGNYNMEPPSLFRGRGEHPKTGSLKKRCFPESVNINLSANACIPKVDMPGHAWGTIRHDPVVTWLSGWVENVQSQNKYVMLAASSSFKGMSDTEKYQTAIRLKGCIGKVRENYTKMIKGSDDAQKQLGVAMWVIDALALRVGGEKGDDEADTVGCCSLRLEHLKFNPNPESYEIELEFLGKDSMLFKQNISFSRYGDIGKRVYKCFKDFCAGKGQSEQVFDTLTPPVLNKHLDSIMKGLTAKVFRTYNASVTLEQELPSVESLKGLSVQDKLLQYNAANRQVAILCNHQRTVSKATEQMFEGLNEKLATLRDQYAELLKWRDLAKKNKEDKIPLLDDDQKAKTEKLQAELQKCMDTKESAKGDEAKLKAAANLEAAKTALRDYQKTKFNTKHYYKSTPSESSIDSRIKKWSDDIRKLEVDIRNRDENKEVALGTSKINYMDPRISVAWCKRCEVPIDKIFAKTLRDKFNWAMAVPPEWKFE